ncbi:MAG TPA: hypothetical protein VKH64_18000 [Candidatus Binatia bacterium]|nr:hypothetical protein [Candidatus Binatia bacterium]
MLKFTIQHPFDPNNASLRRLLEAHVVYERMTAAKKFGLHLLAAVGAIVWLGAEWPQFLPARVLDSALAVWAALLFFCVLATVEEWVWHRKVSRYIDEQQTKQRKAG